MEVVIILIAHLDLPKNHIKVFNDWQRSSRLPEASWHGAEHWVFGQPWCFSSYLPFSQLLGSVKTVCSHHRQSQGIGGIQNEVIMLPVFPIMALSGPLFTEMNDGEAGGEGCCADRWGCGVLCRHLWFHARCQQYVNNLSLSNLWKRGAPAFVFAFTFSYESPASYCTCYFVTDFEFLGERLIDNLYPHKLRWIFRDSWNSIFNVLHLSPFVFLVPLLRPGWVAALPFWLSLAACGWEVSCLKSMRSWSFDGHKPVANRFLGGDSLYLGLCESYFWPWGVLAFALGKTLLHDYARRASILALHNTHDSLMCRGVEQAGKGCV